MITIIDSKQVLLKSSKLEIKKAKRKYKQLVTDQERFKRSQTNIIHQILNSNIPNWGGFNLIVT